MFISSYSKNNFTVKFKDYDINIFDYDEVMNICKEIIKKIISKDENFGIYMFDIYTNCKYGLIIDGEKMSDKSDGIDIKINFHVESTFLEEIDYFSYNNKNKIIFYYDNKFYIEYDKDFLTDSYILYGDKVYEILNKAIVINK